MKSGRLALLVFAASAGAMVSPSPAESRSGWREIISAHFVITTDLDREDARATALYFERVRAALLAYYPQDAGRDERIRAFVLADEVEFSHMFHASGFFTRDLFGPLVATSGRPGYSGRQAWRGGAIVRHELAHEIMFRLIHYQPRWLSEGLASYFETLEISDEAKKATFGHVNIHLQRDTRMTVADTMDPGLPWSQCTDCYVAAWWLVHWLMNQRSDQFNAFLGQLNHGQTVKAAWEKAFPELSIRDADDELRRYKEGGRYHTYVVSIATVPTELTEKALTEADVHATRAMLLLRAGVRQEDPVAILRSARTEVDQALGADSSNLLGLFVMSELQPSLRKELSERAVAAHGDRAEAWLMRAFSLPEGEGAKKEDALKTAVRLDGSNVYALRSLASLYTHQKSYLRALPLIKNALQLAPRDAPAWDTYAAVAFGLKNCREAINAETRAIEALHESTKATPFQQRLADYQRTCPKQSTDVKASPTVK